MKTEKILAYTIALVLALALSIAGILLIGAETQYVYEYEVTASTWDELNDAIQNATGSVIIELTDDIMSTATLAIPTGRRIKLTGSHSLTTAGNHAVVTVNGHFTLDGPTLTRLAESVTGNASRGVVVTNGTLIISSGEISEHRVNGNGAGVFSSNSTLIMTGGSIINNEVLIGSGTRSGGGVFFSGNNANFTMYDGLISGNKVSVNSTAHSRPSGGGVHFNGNTFTMHGGEISDNTISNNGMSQGAHGGGVSINGLFVMHDGKITNNNVFGLIGSNSGGHGGGVFLYGANGTFHMHNGLISGNTVSGGSNTGGGGVAIGRQNSAVVTLGGTFIMYNGEISNNTSSGCAHGNGGGVSAYQNSVFVMHNGLISDNTVTATSGTIRGGGIMSVNSNSFITIYNGIITRNQAFHSGSGVADGGGVVAWSGTTFTMHNGEISNNSADFGGGVWHGDRSLGWMTIQAGSIINNTARRNGGGIFTAAYNGTIINPSVTFSGNTAATLHNFYLHPQFTPGGTVSAANSGGGNGGSTANINWASVSVPGTHALNNYDINFTGRPYIRTMVTVTFHADSGGSLSSTPANSITVPVGTTLAAGQIPTPTPSNGYQFTAWTSNSTAGENPLGFVVTEDVTFTANFTPTLVTVTFLPGTNGTFANYVTYIAFQVPVGAVLTAANVPNVTENADWTHIGWATNPMTNPVGFEVNEDVTFVAQYSPVPVMVTVTFLPGTNGAFANNVAYITFQVPVGTILTAADIPNILENADWKHIGWATNPMTNPVGFVVNADVTFVAQYETTYNGGSPNTGIYGFAIGAIALVTLGGVMFVFVKKADKASV